jgi:two-component system sensor histidine kinase SenX3
LQIALHRVAVESARQSETINMNFLLRRRAGMAFVVLILAAVLLGLAILQFRWSGELSEAATQRMQAALHSSLGNFRQDLARELAGICLEFQFNGDDASRDAKVISHGLERWRRAAAHPTLVADVYVWQATPDGKDKLLHLDLRTGELRRADWPARYQELHQRLQKAVAVLGPIQVNLSRYQKFHPELEPGPPEVGFESKGFGGVLQFRGAEQLPGHAGRFLLSGIPAAPWLLDQNIPALIHPLLPGQNANRSGRGGSHVMTWLMIALNQQTLQQHILPELAQRHFGGTDGLAYKVAVVSAEGIIYSSDAGFPTRPEIDPDAKLNLFGPSIVPDKLFGPPIVPGKAGLGMTFSMTAPATARVDPPIGLLHEFHDVGPLHIEPIPFNFPELNWQLIVKHRKGSVEAAVASLHRRNLTVSFGVLLVLALTMALVIITSQRAHRLAQLQMDFVTGVSHELRTPLAVISSAAENIADGVVTNERQLVRYATVIKNQSKQLIHLVEQVLLFAATRQSRQHYNLRPLQVSEVIDAVCENTASLAKRGNISVERRIQPNLPLVNADFAALSQCLQNLITNAVKYGGSGRWIGIRTGVAAEGPDASEVRITVEDKGIGIDSEAMRHIFEPFYRSPVVAGSQIRGTGLGLTLAKGMVEAMGGRLTVVSETGNGTAFTIHLPIPVQSDSVRERVVEISANPKFSS